MVVHSDLLGSEETRAQWETWATSRRGLLKGVAGTMAAAALANGGRLPITALAAQDEEAVAGGSLSMSLADDDVQYFDPIIPSDNMSIWTMLLIYDQAIRVGPDGTSLEPGLAESWTISDDLLTYTLTIREALFHDGSSVVAGDVAYSLNRAFFDELSLWKSIVGVVDTVEATDDRTVVVKLSSPWAPFEADLALFAASVVPQAAHEAQGEALFDNPIGSGPFKFSSWEKGQELTLVKNPDYWDQPKPYLDELHFFPLVDANARMLRFQGGELDIVTSVPYSQIESLRANPDVVVLQDAVARLDYVLINCERFPDIAVRQAMNYAVNNQVLLDNILFGNGQRANTLLPLMAGHSDTVPGYEFNLDKAKELMAGSTMPDGFEAEYLVTAGDSVGTQVATIIASMLAEIGGNVTITSLEPAARGDRISVTHEYDFASSYYTTDIIDPDQIISFGGLSGSGGVADRQLYSNPELDALIKQAAETVVWEDRLPLYEQVQQMHSDDAPFIFLFYPTGGVATTAAVHSFRVLPTGNYRLWDTWKDA